MSAVLSVLLGVAVAVVVILVLGALFAISGYLQRVATALERMEANYDESPPSPRS